MEPSCKDCLYREEVIIGNTKCINPDSPFRGSTMRDDKAKEGCCIYFKRTSGLLPCPWCGGRSKLTYSYGGSLNNSYHCECTKCRATGPRSNDPEALVEQWNAMSSLCWEGEKVDEEA